MRAAPKNEAASPLWPLRYARLLAEQLRISASLAMQYRIEFVFRLFMSVFWLAATLLPLLAVFDQRREVMGWTYPETLVVMGWFVLLKGVLEGAVTPSLATVVTGVRNGRLDFILLKPADAQFLVSTARFEPWRALDLVAGLGIFVHAFREMGRAPDLVAVAQAAAMLVMAVALLYSLWILVVSASFWVVRVDNLSYLLTSVFDAARWPVGVFRGAIAFIFTFVLPLALMTTFPARALLGQLGGREMVLCLIGGAAFVTLSRLVWRRAIGAYTSASS